MRSQWVGLGFVGILACSSSESTTSAPPPDTGDAAAPGKPYTIWVYHARDTATDSHTPIGGATVAIDPPGGGERVELTTEADGHVTTNIDFTKGTANISVSAPEHAVISLVGTDPDVIASIPKPNNPVGKPDTDFVFVLPTNGKGSIARSVELSGKITGKTDAGNIAGLMPTGSYQSWQGPADTYAVRVPKDKPFTLMGFEAPVYDGSLERGFVASPVRVFRTERPAMSANGTFDIDVSQGTLSTTPLNWKIEITGGDSGPLGGTSVCFANVNSIDSGANIGLSEKRELLPDKSGWTLLTQLAQTDLAPEQMRSITVIQNTDKSASIAQQLGAAPDGTVFKDYLLPASVIVTKQTRADAISLEGAPAAEQINIDLRSGQDTEWLVITAHKKQPKSVVLPAPPSTASLPGTLSAAIVAFNGFEVVPGRPGEALPTKISVSRPITITR